MALGQLEIHKQKNEALPPIIYQKEFKWIEVLNVRQTNKNKKTLNVQAKTVMFYLPTLPKNTFIIIN